MQHAWHHLSLPLSDNLPNQSGFLLLSHPHLVVSRDMCPSPSYSSTVPWTWLCPQARFRGSPVEGDTVASSILPSTRFGMHILPLVLSINFPLLEIDWFWRWKGRFLQSQHTSMCSRSSLCLFMAYSFLQRGHCRTSSWTSLALSATIAASPRVKALSTSSSPSTSISAGRYWCWRWPVPWAVNRI